MYQQRLISQSKTGGLSFSQSLTDHLGGEKTKKETYQDTEINFPEFIEILWGLHLLPLGFAWKSFISTRVASLWIDGARNCKVSK